MKTIKIKFYDSQSNLYHQLEFSNDLIKYLDKMFDDIKQDGFIDQMFVLVSDDGGFIDCKTVKDVKKLKSIIIKLAK